MWAADSLADATREKVRGTSRAYASDVIDREWPRMRDGTRVDPVGWAHLDETRIAVANTPTEDGWQTDRKTEAAGRLWDVYQARQSSRDHTACDHTERRRDRSSDGPRRPSDPPTACATCGGGA